MTIQLRDRDIELGEGEMFQVLLTSQSNLSLTDIPGPPCLWGP